MIIKIKKGFLYNLLFAFCVIIPFFNNYELSFVCWFFAALLTVKKKYSITFITYLSLFVFILIIAIAVGLFYSHDSYFVLRDITYLLKPILGLLIGYQFYKNNIKQPFGFLLNTGIIMACIHLLLVFYGIVLEGASSVAYIRIYGGYFNDFEIYTLIILIFHKKLELNLSKKRYSVYLLILGLSSFFYLARTNFIQFIILFFALKEWIKLTPKSISIVLSVIVALCVSYFAIYQYNPKRNSSSSVEELMYKIKLIPQEAFVTKIDRDDWRFFHDHYRSYENIRTIEQMSHNNTFLFGEGVGSQVNLKQRVFLGDMYLKEISILHNGYMTILLKSGVFGLILLLVSIGFFFLKFSKVNTADKNINLFFLGTGVFLIASYWVFMGFYNLLDAKTILIGFLFAYKNQLVKTSNKEIPSDSTKQ